MGNFSSAARGTAVRRAAWRLPQRRFSIAPRSTARNVVAADGALAYRGGRASAVRRPAQRLTQRRFSIAPHSTARNIVTAGDCASPARRAGQPFVAPRGACRNGRLCSSIAAGRSLICAALLQRFALTPPCGGRRRGGGLRRACPLRRGGRSSRRTSSSPTQTTRA